MKLSKLLLLITLLAIAGVLRAQEGEVHLTPDEGSIAADMVLSISFPEPMVAPEAINRDDSRQPLEWSPALKGTFLWKSQTEGEFTVTEPVTPGTAYRASTTKNLKDLAGKNVAVHEWEFTSDAFEVHCDEEYREHLSAKPRLSFYSNYRIRAVDVPNAIYFQDRDTHERFAVEAIVDETAGDKPVFEWEIAPRESLPVGREYDVVVDGLRDAESRTPLPFLHVFAAGRTVPLELAWLGAFNTAFDVPVIRAKFSETIDPESVTPERFRIEPPVADLKIRADQDEVIAEGSFDPKQRYTVHVSKEIKGIRGFTLRADEKWGATFRLKPPTILFPTKELFQRSATGLKFAFAHVNTGPVTWTLAEVPPEKFPAVQTPAAGFETAGPDLFQLKVVGSGEFPAGAQDVLETRNVLFKPEKPLSGIYLLETRAPGEGATIVGNRALVFFSEWVLTEKRSAESIMLQVAKMSDGLPAPAGIRVRIVDEKSGDIASAVTDKRGIAAFSNDTIAGALPRKPGWFIAETPHGAAWQMAGATPLGGSSSRAKQMRKLRSLIVTDRNLYRPGEVVKIAGFVREADRQVLTIPAERTLKWSITASGAEVAAGTAELSSSGSWEAEWRVPETQATGSFGMEVKVGEIESKTSRVFAVEEYRVPLFSVLAEAISRPGPITQVKVASNYFHGAPNAGARIHWRAVWQTSETADHYVRHDAYSEHHVEGDLEKTVEGDAVLNSDGTAVLECAPPFTDGVPRGRSHVYWTIEVTSPEGQTLTGGTYAIVQHVPALLGIRAEQEQLDPATMEISVDAVDYQGEQLPGQKARVEVFHVVTKTVKEQVGPFVFRYRNAREFSVVDSREVTVPHSFEIPAPHTGEYVVVASSAESVPVSTLTHVSGPEPAELPVVSETEVPLSLEQPQRAFRAGETAHIAIRAPFPGIAWVSVEAEEVLDTFLVPLQGNSGRIDLPIKPEYKPNVVVSVYLIQPGKETDLPRERYGYVGIAVEDPSVVLNVVPTLEADVVRPGAKVRGNFVVTNSGKPVADAEFVVFAVDDAVLELGGWRMPLTADVFYPSRPHGVQLFAALQKFQETFRSFGEKGWVLGDGTELFGNVNLVRKEFRTLAYWKTKCRTDAEGRLPFAFDAPDNLTSYRIVAIGQTDRHQFGSGDAVVTISKPLICDPALPRFVRAGDEITLRAVARQTFADRAEIRVACSAGEGIELIDTKMQTRTAASGIPAVFAFKARVLDAANATVRFDAESEGGNPDSVENTLPVLPPTVLRRESVMVANAGSEWIPAKFAPPAWIGARGTFDVAISSSPTFPKLQGLPQILEYPHGCFEQITSRILAYTLMHDLLADLPEGAEREAHYRKTIESAWKQMEGSILPNNLLPYWPGRQGNPCVTVLAAWATREAHASGMQISPALQQSFGAAVEGVIAKRISADPFTQCLALMIATERDLPAHKAAAHELFSTRENFREDARAALALAMHQIGGFEKEKAQLMKEIARPVKERAFDPENFGSTTRSDALVTLAFAAIDPEGKQTATRKERLMKLLDDGGALSTQENLWLLLAFKALHEKSTAPRLPVAALAFPPTIVSPSGRSAAWRGSDLSQLAETKIGPIDAGASLTGIASAAFRRPETDTGRDDRGFRVERLIVNLTDASRTGTPEHPMKLGDQVLVTYRLTTRKLHHYVAMEDLLPAGLETVNPDLPMIGRHYNLPLQDDGARMLELSHSELRDQSTRLYFDRVDPGSGTWSVLARATCAGHFRWPAVQVTPMYDSRSGGLSASSECVVTD
jgi:uncharacterized protein YfaS (alpha-2-macroglobulin family)